MMNDPSTNTTADENCDFLTFLQAKHFDRVNVIGETSFPTPDSPITAGNCAPSALESSDDLFIKAVVEGFDTTELYLARETVNIDSFTREGWSALMIAVFLQDKSTTELLILKGVQINMVNKEGWSAVMIACLKGGTDIFDILIKNKADLDIKSYENWNALMVASFMGYKSIVEMILLGYEKVDEQNDDGFTAMMLAAQNGFTDVVEELLNSGADVNRVNNNGWSALMLATVSGHVTTVDMLLQRDVNINVVDKEGWNAFLLASVVGDVNIIRMLLERGCDALSRGVFSRNALMFAAQRGHSGAVKILLEETQIDPKSVDSFGLNALMLAARNGHDAALCELFYTVEADCVNTKGENALILATERGNASTVKLLLDKGTDVNLVNIDGFNALMIAAKNGYVEIVSELLKCNCEVNITSKRGQNALMIASAYGHSAVVGLLLGLHKINLNDIDNEGYNALMLASYFGRYETVELLLHEESIRVNYVEKDGWSSLMLAAQEGHSEVVRSLLSQRANANILNIEDFNALMLASKAGFDPVVEVLMKDTNVDLMRITEKGRNALMIAALHGKTKVVELLLNTNIDVTDTDRDGMNALMLASFFGHDDVVKLLLQTSKIDTNHVNFQGWNALVLAMVKGNNSTIEILLDHGIDINQGAQNNCNAIILAAQNGYTEATKILLRYGADVNLVDNDGWNALLMASEGGHTSIVELLIEAGAEINSQGKDGSDALMLAAKENHISTVEVLLEKGININMTDESGENTFMVAVKNGHREIVEILLGSNFDLNCVSKNNMNALMKASAKGHVGIVELLLKHGVDVNFKNVNNCTAIYYAAEHLNFDVYSLLIKNGANVEEKNKLLWDILFLFTENLAGSSFIPVADESGMVKSDRFPALFQDIFSKLKQQDLSFYDIKDQIKEAIQILAEISFDQLQFYLLQKCINLTVKKQYTKNKETGNFLAKHGYIDLTIKILKEQCFLLTEVHTSSLPVLMNSLEVIVTLSDYSNIFTQCLADKGFIILATERLTENIGKMMPTKIVFMLFTVLLNISQLSGKENDCEQFPKLEILKYYLQFNSVDLVLTIKMLFSMVSENVSDEMDLDEVQTEKLISYIKYASAKDKRKHKGFRLIKLIKGLAKLAISDKTKLKIKTCFETFITILQKSEPEELESTIECLQAISTHNTESYKIVEDKMLVKTLASLQDKANDSIKSKVNSVLWESGNTSGIFPELAGQLFSSDFPKDFEIKSECLGKGSFGSVHLVVDNSKNEPSCFVAKKINVSRNRRDPNKIICRQEASILLKVHHENIVQFHGFEIQNDAFIIFLEYLQMGTLKDHIASHLRLEENEAKHFTSQILQGVKYLHENGILHRDIKSSNILMQSETKVKISDFGLSKILKDQRNIDLSTSVGTVFYMAPEVLKTETVVIYPTKADIWSIGCTVVDMITGMPPYAKDYNCFQVKGRIAANEIPEYELPQLASDALKDFLMRIFKRNPCERPSAEKLLDHIFIVDK